MQKKNQIEWKERQNRCIDNKKCDMWTKKKKKREEMNNKNQ